MTSTTRFIQTDGGRSVSKRPKQRNDCTVRALAVARGWASDKAYDDLAFYGRKCGEGFRMATYLNDMPWAGRYPFPAVKGERRMNPATFCEQFPIGTWICKTAKHVFVIKDGCIYDMVPQRDDRCIYTAWKINTNL